MNEPLIFANREGRLEQLKMWIGLVFANDKPYCLISVSKNTLPGGFDRLPNQIRRALIVFEDSPASIDAVQAWRNWAVASEAFELHIAFLSFFKGSEEERFKEIARLCKGWEKPIPKPETPEIEIGKVVRLSNDSTKARKEGKLATLLTMTLGSTGELLTRVELLARRFQAACSASKDDEASIKGYLRDVRKLLKEGSKKLGDSPSLQVAQNADWLPKLLLRGHSGTGKSLIAAYINQRLGWSDKPPLRISIPEFLGKEEDFEFAFFGYCKGAYTGGREDGSPGLLLENTGRVVFLDEIGEANDYLQAKLLAFLDDFNVRPRGWEGDPFFCPVLIVAATNKDLDAMAKEKEKPFRDDLLARFTDRLTIPNLNSRREDLPFILDCLLQRPAMNPKGTIKEIGEEAFTFIKNLDFDKGNFRQLENHFRRACENANRDGRHYLVKADFELAASESSDIYEEPGV